VARRPAPARGQRQGRSASLCGSRGRLFRPPPREAGHHRRGADQRLARRNRHAREDPEARRARPVLHRKLVDPVRPLHPGAHADCADQDRERLLITAQDTAIRTAGIARTAPVVMPAAALPFRERLLLVMLYIAIFTSSVAFIEPSPHDFLMGVLALACVIAGVRFERRLAALFLLLLVWNLGGLLSLLNVPNQEKAIQYTATSIYLALAAVMYGCLFADNTMTRLKVMRSAYVATAVIASILGMLGYFNAFG